MKIASRYAPARARARPVRGRADRRRGCDRDGRAGRLHPVRAHAAGVALFHHHTLQVALTGLAVITLYKLVFTGFKTGPGLAGLAAAPAARVGDPHQPARPAARLRAAVESFREEPACPAVLPRFLPDDWKGAFVLLVMVFVLSSFLDNIAAALIGGTIAATVFRAQGAHRLPGRHRRRVQRRRRGQRGRRHHHHHDVDRRREPAGRARRLRRGRRGAGGLRHPGGAAAARAIRRSSRTRRPGIASTGRASRIVADHPGRGDRRPT